MPMSEVVLKVKNLKKAYPSGVVALKDISFEVQKGEFLVIVGLSGSGKSTLLRCLNRLHDCDSGEIFFNGIDIVKIKVKASSRLKDLRKSIAMVFQNLNLVPRHSVLENVLVGKLAQTPLLKSLFGFFSDTQKKEALNYLRLVGIEDKAHQRADQLSGGQQQRVAIARALAQNPVILLADEPVASLDPATSHVVMDYLKKINEELGITIICNLHFLSLVRAYATRVLALKDGAIVFDGPATAINQALFEEIYGADAREIHAR